MSDYRAEAERQCALYVERQRQQRVASDILSAAFRDGEVGARVDPKTISDTEGESYEDAREAARAYAIARNSNARIRSYNENDESARAGVRSALDWLSRKKKSAIRK